MEIRCSLVVLAQPISGRPYITCSRQTHTHSHHARVCNT